jgi:hypothetical protein
LKAKVSHPHLFLNAEHHAVLKETPDALNTGKRAVLGIGLQEIITKKTVAKLMTSITTINDDKGQCHTIKQS